MLKSAVQRDTSYKQHPLYTLGRNMFSLKMKEIETKEPYVRTNRFVLTKLNFVLDLDETLVSSSSSENANRPGCAVFGSSDNKIYINPRPYLAEFIQSLDAKFNVCVWTAGTHDYGKFIVEAFILPNLKEGKLKFFLTRCHCNETRISTMVKRVAQVSTANFSSCEIAPSFSKNDISEVNMINTVVLDDLEDVYRGQEDNVIQIPPFHYSNQNDDVLLKLKNKIDSRDNFYSNIDLVNYLRSNV